MDAGKQELDKRAQPDDSEPSPERQAELQVAYDANMAAGNAPYASVRIVTAGELHWILRERGWSGASALPGGKHRADLTGLDAHEVNLSGIRLTEALLEKADLTGATLVGAHLARATLVDAELLGADLSRADLSAANLTGAALGLAQLMNANLSGASLIRAELSAAQLDKANLSGANLSRAKAVGTNFSNAWAEKVTLAYARVEDADLGGAWLHAADFRHASLAGARMDPRTVLAEAHLDMTTALVDVVWNGAPLTAVDWSHIARIGDELVAQQRVAADGKRKDRARRTSDYIAASRAYRQLAVALRNQGMNEEADRFAYRAQLCQRRLLRLRRDYLRYLGSLFLGVVAGYGYRPLRTLFWYLAVIGSFAFAFYVASRGVVTFGLPPSSFGQLAWYEALVLSVSSFHGRGFLPFPNLGDPITILAAIEAVFGLFIEVSFIATFTQRYFGK